jgi:NADH-quinone oxidoreductase subunit D
VLRLIVELSGEVVLKVDPHVGLLHRSTEQLLSTMSYLLGIPYFDRLDYVSTAAQEHAYCLTIERLLGVVDLAHPINYIRVLFDEITRILNHFLAIACHALDVGSMSCIFWAFEEREKLMGFYERATGARMHVAYHKPVSFFTFDLDDQFFDDLCNFVNICYTTIEEIHNVLSNNKVWKQRLINIGSLSYENCRDFSLTGVLLRSTGVRRDLRLSNANSYSGYNKLLFKSFIGSNGDSYDRYLIRMLEMLESLSIINKVVSAFRSSDARCYFFNSCEVVRKFIVQNDLKIYTSMDDLISHFMLWHVGFKVRSSVSVSFIEAPKGEFGVSIVSNDSELPHFVKIRSPSYFSLQSFYKLVKGHTLSDLSCLIGTVDIVFGEIDR